MNHLFLECTENFLYKIFSGYKSFKSLTIENLEDRQYKEFTIL